MTNREWILRAIKLGIINPSHITSEDYISFKEYTQSKATFRSFKRIVRAVQEAETIEENSLDPDESSFSFDKDDSQNEATAEGVVTSIKDPEEIMKEWGISSDKWQIVNCKITKQTIYGEDRQGSLEWKEGVMNGSLTYSGRTVEPIFHVKMSLVKKAIDKIQFPVVQPIVIEILKTLSFHPVKSLKNSRKALILNDAQIGFKRNERNGNLTPIHDRLIWDLVLQTIKSDIPDDIIINGDMMDLSDLTDSFIVSPEFSRTFQPSLNELSVWLGWIRDLAPEARIIYIEGNHEQRLNKNLMKNAAAAYGLKKVTDIDGFPVMSIPSLLDLNSLNIKWVGEYPKGRIWLTDNICVSHAEKNRTRVDSIFNDLTHIEIMGHVHRYYCKLKTIFERDSIKYAGIISLPAMCDIEEKVPSGTARNDWQTGFGMMTYSFDDSVPPEIKPILVKEGRAFVNGELLVGEDRSKELAKIVNWPGIVA